MKAWRTIDLAKSAVWMLWVVLLTASALSAAAPAATPGEHVSSTRASVKPIIDGRLDDEVWQTIKPYTSFRQSEPLPGTPAKNKTEVWVAHDGDTIYFALRLHSDSIQSLKARAMWRDSDAINGDDSISLVIDPRGAARNGFFFRINPLGAQRDGLIFDGVKIMPDWDGLWTSVARVNDNDWTVEVAIPMSTIGTPEQQYAWRFNVQRFTAATGERDALFGAEAGRAIFSLVDAGALLGIASDRPVLGLRLRPSVTVAHHQRANGGKNVKVRPTLDAFYLVKPGVTASATLNNDFADTEADDRVIDLSRFEFFRPEKRAFFTQDAGRFEFGGLVGGDAGILPFFSRRIALGEVLDAGAKLSGSSGPYEFGVLGAQVRRGDRELTPRVSVLRVARLVGTAHRAGIIATSGNPEGTPGSSLIGADYHFRTTVLDGERDLDTFAWVLESRNKGLGVGQAQGASVQFQGVGPWLAANWRRVDERFRPALGYLRESGVTNLSGEAGYETRLAKGGTVLSRLFFARRERHDGSEDSGYLGPNLQYDSPTGDQFGVEVLQETERLAAPFELLPGIIIAEGDWRWKYVGAYARTSPTRVWSGKVFVRRGGYFQGTLAEQDIELSYRPNSAWAISTALNRYDVEVPGARYIARTVSARLEHASSVRAQQIVLIQYDSVSSVTSIGARMRWDVGFGRDVLFELDRNDVPNTPQPEFRVAVRMRWNFEW